MLDYNAHIIIAEFNNIKVNFFLGYLKPENNNNLSKKYLELHNR